MGKAKKHGKPSKGASKKGNKNDKNKRKAKFIDPTSSVSRDVRESVAALVEEIEREEPVEEEKPNPIDKAEKKRQELAKKEGIQVKSGMTKEQANKIANKLKAQQSTTYQSDDDNNDEESDEEDDNGTEEDYSDTANEPAREYRKGGYHHVVVGEIYNNRYRIVRKLGWGYFSTVWLVWDYEKERYQAMKIQKSAASYSEAAYDEIKLLTEIMEADPHKNHCCARLNDYFKHTGPNGTHVCMVFDVYGENLLSLMERYEYRGIPLPIVKCIARQVLIGLDHINSIDIIHTDLKPENVLLSTPKHSIISLMKRFHPPPLHQRPKLTERDPKTMTKSQRRRYYKKLAKEERKALLGDDDDDNRSNNTNDNNANGELDSEGSKTDPEWEVERFHHVILADFGNSCWTYKQFTDEVQTRQYRCPEVILGEPYSTPIDIWSCACMLFELITGQFLFDPKKGDDYSRDEDHLALMTELLGDLPETMRLGSGKYRSYYYNSKGELRNIKDLQYWNLEDVLHQRHKFTRKKAREIAEFLLPMLEYVPESRATPAAMLRDHDAFFDIEDDDYAPLCFVDEGSGDDDASASEEEDDGGNKDLADSYSSTSSSKRKLSRSRQADNDTDRTEAFRYWEEHPILNRSYLEDRGLTIADIQSVLAGNMLESRAAQEAAAEVIRLLSEETDRLSNDRASDGHEADKEDEGDDDGDDDAASQISDAIVGMHHGGGDVSSDEEDEESDEESDEDAP